MGDIISIEIPIAQLQRIYSRNQKIAHVLTGKESTLYAKIGQIVSRRIGVTFVEEGRPAWEPRLYDRIPPYYQHRKLHKTGKMLQKALRSTQRQWQHSRYAHWLDILAPPYGKYHQYGRYYKWAGKVIKRKYVNLQPEDHAAIRETIIDTITSPDITI